MSSALIALILHSCYRLAKLGMEDWLQWVIVAASLAITVAPQAEVALLSPRQPQGQGFVKGAYTAAIGTILGAGILLGKIAIGDGLTALVALLSLVVLFRWNVSSPIVVAVTAVIGLIAFPLLQPTWVFVK